MNKIAVIGAGSWGTALATILANNGHKVTMHSIRKEIADEITKHHTNLKYLPYEVLPTSLTCTTSYEEAVKDADYILLVVPSQAMRKITKEIAPFLAEGTVIIHASKGLEIESLKTMSEVIKEETLSSFHDDIVVFSGPSHAEEVVKKLPTTIVAASNNLKAAEKVQKLFMNSYVRVYTNHDVVGVELGGSLKNIIALGAGLSDGLGFGDNAKAALLTRGIAEIAKLGVLLGANPLTFAGLTGIGDLIVTGTSHHSRNWKTGNLLANGVKLEDALESLGMVAEGVKTTKAAYELSKKLNVSMPITTELYYVLFENKDPKDAVRDLMEREKNNELNYF